MDFWISVAHARPTLSECCLAAIACSKATNTLIYADLTTTPLTACSVLTLPRFSSIVTYGMGSETLRHDYWMLNPALAQGIRRFWIDGREPVMGIIRAAGVHITALSRVVRALSRSVYTCHTEEWAMPNRRPGNQNTRQPRPAAPFTARPKPWPTTAARPEPKSSHNAQRNYERYLALALAEARAGNIIGAENYYQHAEHYFRSMSSDRGAR
jgi:hypothetical protein